MTSEKGSTSVWRSSRTPWAAFPAPSIAAFVARLENTWRAYDVSLNARRRDASPRTRGPPRLQAGYLPRTRSRIRITRLASRQMKLAPARIVTTDLEGGEAGARGFLKRNRSVRDSPRASAAWSRSPTTPPS